MRICFGFLAFLLKSMSGTDKKTDVGGQAVIEGVMMRSPSGISVAVRRKDGTILVKNDAYISLAKRFKFFKLPFIRGGIILLESLFLGVKTLSWSSKVAINDEQDDGKDNKNIEVTSNIITIVTVIFGLGAGIGLFFYLPLFLTDLIGLTSGFYFNLVDSLIRIAIFIGYILLISRWEEVRRVFQYHGAEHKSIFAYENGEELSIENVNNYGTHHPRCGTSFLVIVIMVSFLVFLFLGRPDTIGEKLIRFLFIPVIGGLSYEFIKLADKKKHNKILRHIISPGLWLQKITTQEPDEKQLKVGIIALKSALGEQVENDEEVNIFKGSLNT